VAAMTATRWLTRSAASTGSRSYYPSAHRYSNLTLRPSAYPVSLRPCWKALTRKASASGVPPPSNPITGVVATTPMAARGVGYGLRPSRRGPGHDWWGQRWRSPGSRAERFCACQGLQRRGAGSCLAITTLTILPSVGRKTSAPRTCLTPLNT
jgi:hypothetical protein